MRELSGERGRSCAGWDSHLVSAYGRAATRQLHAARRQRGRRGQREHRRVHGRCGGDDCGFIVQQRPPRTTENDAINAAMS